MGIDWEDILGNDVEDLQDAYDSLVYDSGKYLSNDYGSDYDGEYNTAEPKSKEYHLPPAVEEAFALPF